MQGDWTQWTREGQRLRAAALLVCVLSAALLAPPAAEAASPTDGPSFGNLGLFAAAATPADNEIASSRRRRRRHSHRRRIRNTRDLGRSASPAVGGGFSMLAPWPAGTSLVAGGKCGFFMSGDGHRDYGGQWDDDRKAIDFGLCGASDLGTPILAAHSGTVQVASEDSAYGKTVVIEMSKNGFATRYAHLHKLSVKRKQKVTAGQQIGTLGYSAAGGKDNAHLHFAAYKSRKARAGTSPSPMAGLTLCDGCLVESLTAKGRGDPFQAALQSISVGDGQRDRVEVTPGQLLEFVFTVRFDEPFDAERFVMRPANAEVGRFAVAAGDLGGALTGIGGDTGAYAGVLHVPADAAPGEHRLSWDAVNAATGQNGNARATLTLVVKPPPPSAPVPRVFPSPRPGAPDWEATPVALDYPRIVATAQSAEVVLKLQNSGTAIWDSKVRLATSDDSPIRHLLDGLGQNRVGSSDEDGNGLVVPGEIATFRYSVSSGQATAYTQAFTLARDSAGGKRFGDVQLPMVIADEQHWPPELTRAHCTWKYIGQAGGLSADGQSGQWTFTLKNDSTHCPWFRSGSAPFRLGTQRPQDRGSLFYDAADPAWLTPDRVQIPHQVAPGETVSVTFRLKPHATVNATTYPEYFAPVIDGFAWLDDPGMHAPLDSSVRFITPTGTVAVPVGGDRTFDVSVVNRTGRTWQRGTDNLHYVDASGNDLRYDLCGPNPGAGWVNRNAIQFNAPTVPPGQTAVYSVRVCGAPGYVGPATLRLRYVQEHVSHYNPIFQVAFQFG